MNYDWIIPPEALPGRPITRHLKRYNPWPMRLFLAGVAAAMYGLVWLWGGWA